MSIPSSDHPAAALLSDLLAVPAPSGREESIAAIIREKLDALGYSHETDGCGNVLVRLPGRDPKAPLCVLAAHMDEIGLVVTRVLEDGTLKVARSGGLLPHKIGERPLTVVGDNGTITGILSLGSGHAPAAGQAVSWEDAKVITGLPIHKLREAGIRPGSTAVPIAEGRGPVILGDPSHPLMAAWTLDDRAGVLTLLRLLNEIKQRDIQLQQPTIIAFTIHEEGGAHGAKVLAQRERPEIFIAVDGCPIPPGSDIQMDSRPAAWSKDGKAHYDQRLVRKLAGAARAAGTELQMAVQGEKVFSDASAVYDCGGAARVAIIGHVRDNSHGYEVAELAAFDNLLETLVQLVKNRIDVD